MNLNDSVKYVLKKMRTQVWSDCVKDNCFIIHYKSIQEG